MAIETKVRLVKKLFHRLENEINTFQTETSFHCLSDCGKCCTKPDIDASPLEFLPWAFHLFLNGQAEIILDILKTKTNSNCQLYHLLTIIDRINGNCSNYKYRGLICRLLDMLRVEINWENFD